MNTRGDAIRHKKIGRAAGIGLTRPDVGAQKRRESQWRFARFSRGGCRDSRDEEKWFAATREKQGPKGTSPSASIRCQRAKRCYDSSLTVVLVGSRGESALSPAPRRFDLKTLRGTRARILIRSRAILTFFLRYSSSGPVFDSIYRAPRRSTPIFQSYLFSSQDHEMVRIQDAHFPIN